MIRHLAPPLGVGRAAEAEDLVDKIDVHDSDHFEVKLDYAVDPRQRSHRYEVQTYFFIPQSLGINRHTYAREQFYSDVQAYIRFKTPQLELQTLASETDPRSPLAALARALVRLEQDPGDAEGARQATRKARLFGCIARTQLRDRVRAIRDELRGEHANGLDVAATARSVESLLTDIATMSAAWRARRARLTVHGYPGVVSESFALIDEALSLSVETRLTALLRLIDRNHHPGLRECRACVRRRLLAEREYRAQTGYPSVLRDDDDNEHYVYRRGLLKKLVSSVLWLEIERPKDGGGAAQVAAAIAAGIAMALTLMATLLHSHWFLVNTAGFVAAATVTYMLKDRVKDWLKQFFSRKLSRWLADDSLRIRDPVGGAVLGRCRESFSFVSDAAIPPEVYAARHAEARTSLETLAKPEAVIKYERDVQLDGRAIDASMHPEDHDVTDIVRFGLAQLLVRADDPKSQVAVFDPVVDRVERRALAKVYHLNVVMVLRSATATVTKRVRVVFDKRGIRRLEQVL